MFRRALENLKVRKGKGKEGANEFSDSDPHHDADHQRGSFESEEEQLAQQQRLEEEEKQKRIDEALEPIRAQIRRSRYTRKTDFLERLLIDAEDDLQLWRAVSEKDRARVEQAENLVRLAEGSGSENGYGLLAAQQVLKEALERAQASSETLEIVVAQLELLRGAMR